jgi:hypothetical protein
MEAMNSQLSHQSTRWTRVREAANSAGPAAAQALSAPCESIWYPALAFLRRSGKASQDTKKPTLGFDSTSPSAKPTLHLVL